LSDVHETGCSTDGLDGVEHRAIVHEEYGGHTCPLKETLVTVLEYKAL